MNIGRMYCQLPLSSSQMDADINMQSSRVGTKTGKCSLIVVELFFRLRHDKQERRAIDGFGEV